LNKSRKKLKKRRLKMASITINTNLASLTAQRNLSQATTGMNTAMERLTTGFRINSGKDDAAGAAEALAALKSMYAALTPPLKERASQLRHVGCYGNKQLYEILERLLPEKRSN
jgi:hypothetical protein